MEEQTVEVRPTTTLGQVLKLVGVVETGGEAKHLIGEGEVTVNGVVERRRGYKLSDGDVVVARGRTLRIIVVP